MSVNCDKCGSILYDVSNAKTKCGKCGDLGYNWRPYNQVPEIKCSNCLRAEGVKQTYDEQPKYWVPAVPSDGGYYFHYAIPCSTENWRY